MLVYWIILPSVFVEVIVGKVGDIYKHLADAVFIGAGSLCQDSFSLNTHRVGEAPGACYKMLQFVTGTLYPDLVLDAASYWTFSQGLWQ